MNKSEFIAAIADELKSTKAEGSKAVDAILKVITNALKSEQEVRLVGFGTFKVTKVAAKEVRNPQTGKMITVAASKRPKFVSGKYLKDAVNS